MCAVVIWRPCVSDSEFRRTTTITISAAGFFFLVPLALWHLEIPESIMAAVDRDFRSEEREADRIVDDREDGVSSSTCGCFFGFRSRLSRSNSVRCRYLLLQPQQENEEVKESWMMKKVRKIKGILGRKWRSFISGIFNKRRSVKFQYDPRSYALNFDEGIGNEGGFRARYASPAGLEIGMNRDNRV